jgi:hypothetical protein
MLLPGDWIHDFVHSDNPKLPGKSKAERKKMALWYLLWCTKEAYDVNSDATITTDTFARSYALVVNQTVSNLLKLELNL